MQDFDYTQYRKNNPLLKESLSGTLSQYLKSSAEKCFSGGGNGENLLQYGLPEVAAMIDANMVDSTDRHSYEEDGFYTEATAIAFKKLIDSIVKDEIENNNASKYGAGDDEDTYDEFTDTINNLK